MKAAVLSTDTQIEFKPPAHADVTFYCLRVCLVFTVPASKVKGFNPFFLSRLIWGSTHVSERLGDVLLSVCLLSVCLIHSTSGYAASFPPRMHRSLVTLIILALLTPWLPRRHAAHSGSTALWIYWDHHREYSELCMTCVEIHQVTDNRWHDNCKTVTWCFVSFA